MIFVVDIDGTLADNSHRVGYVQSTQKDWDAFYRPELVIEDKPIASAQRVLPQLVKTPGVSVHLLTGRPEKLRETTCDWFARHFDMCVLRGKLTSLMLVHGWVQLHMREDGDFRPPNIYKEELLKYIALVTRYRPVLIDDDLRNETMYKKHGLFLKAPECWDVIV